MIRLSAPYGQYHCSTAHNTKQFRTSGAPTERSAVFRVNGVICATRPNLYELLQHLRHRNFPRTLWVDGICINQNDTTERDHQVAQMRDVYTTARNVVAWLGPKTHESILAFEAFKVWGDSAHQKHHWDTSHELCFDKRLFSQHYVSAIDAFMHRPWWHRVWTLQETILPRTLDLVCGNSILPFEALVQASKSFFGHYGDCCPSAPALNASLTEHLSTILNLQIDREKYEYERTDLLGIAIAHCRRHCLDPKDKIYGILGLANANQIQSFKIDHDQTLRQVYVNAAFGFLQYMTSLDLLSLVLPQYVIFTPQQGGALPGWVPDWVENGKVRDFIDIATRVDLLRFFDASRGLPKYVIGDGINTISVRGTIVGQILHVGDPELGQDMGSIGRIINSWRNMCTAHYDMSLPYLGVGKFATMQTHPPEEGSAVITDDTLQTIESAFWLTVCSSIVLKNNKHVFISNVVDYTGLFASWWRWITEHATDMKLDVGGEMSLLSANVLVSIRGRRFFLCDAETGLMGLAPRNAEPGDYIVVLAGGRVPYIIRPCGSTWQFIGDSYVHGIMQGEAVEPDEELKTFILT